MAAAVKLMSPVPDAFRELPTEVLLFDQLKVSPVVFALKLMLTAEPGHT